MSMFTSAVSQMVISLAESEAFRTWCGATDADDAIANYIFDYATQIDTIPATVTRFATVSFGTDFALTRQSTGNTLAAFEVTTGTVITFQWRLTAAQDYSQANKATYLTDLGLIFTDILALSGQTANQGRYIHGLRMVQDPQVQEENGDIPSFRYPRGSQPKGYLAIFAEDTMI